MKRYSLTGKCICHCSGAMSSAVFSEIDQMGAFGYSIHPLFAVHSRLQSYQEISKAYFTVEGAPEYLDFWKTYLENLGNPVRIIDAEKKALYHSAAVFASNLVAGLYEAGVRLLTECGFDEKSGQEALSPLFVNNCLNVAKAGPMAALTGRWSGETPRRCCIIWKYFRQRNETFILEYLMCCWKSRSENIRTGLWGAVPIIGKEWTKK